MKLPARQAPSARWTLGDNDGVIIFEAPDDETATTLLLQVRTQGNVQTTTCRAFTTAEITRMLARMSEGK